MFLNTTTLDALNPAQRQLLQTLAAQLIDGIDALTAALLDSNEARAIEDPDLLVDYITGGLQVARDNAQRLDYHLKRQAQ